MRKDIAEQVTSGVKCCPLCGHNGAKNWLQAPDRFHGRSQLYQLVRCSSCSLVWLANPPRPNEMGHHYGPDYDRLIAGAGECSPERWRKRWESLSQHKSCGALLDLGCSNGSFFESLKGESWRLYGIEMSAESAREAEGRSGAQVFVGDVLSAPFGPESFDVITCFDVLEHLYEPAQVMEKVFEWLKPNGIFYTLLPNIDSAEARVFRSYWYPLELPRHLFHFSPTSLRNVAKSVHLQEVSVTTRRNSGIEYSIRYVCDELLQRLRIKPTPLASAKGPTIFWRVVRKLLRLTVLPLFSGLISLTGDGGGIHAVFRKEAS